MIRIGDTVGAIDPGDIAIVLEIVRVGIGEIVWIETHEGEIGEEERTAGADADVEFDAEIGVAVEVPVAVGGARPAAAVIDGIFDWPAQPV